MPKSEIPGKDVLFEKESAYNTSVYVNQYYFASLTKNKYLGCWKITFADESKFAEYVVSEFSSYSLAKDFLVNLISCI